MQPYWESHADNTSSVLKGGSKDIHRDLYNQLKARPKNYFWDFRFTAGMWDGWERYFSLSDNRIATGLIPFARELGFNFEEVILAEDPLEDFRESLSLKLPDDPSQILTPNSYQNESVLAVQGGIRRGIFDHVTAAGKSVTMALLIQLLQGLQTVVTVPTIDLLQQLSDDLAKMLDEPIGILGGGKKSIDGQRIVVAYDGFLKTYIKSPFVTDLAKNCQVLISDELQTITKKLYPFFKKCTKAYYRFGFSGSFFDNDPARIFATAGYFGNVITQVTDVETMAEGRTVPPIFNFYGFPTLVAPGMDYQVAYKDRIVDNEAFNKFFAQLLSPYYEQEKTILVLVKRVAHCASFAKALAEFHMESEPFHGSINTEVRRARRAQFKNGKIPVLIATEQTLGVGSNFPRIEVLMNLGCGLSDDKTKQKYGRSFRSFDEGKSQVDIIEPYPTGCKWFVKHAKARMAMAKTYATGSVFFTPFMGTAVKM